MARPTIHHHNLNDPVTNHVQPRVTTVRHDQTVGEALTTLRGQELGEKIVYFYVVDAENRLVGVVPVRRLLMSPVDVPIKEIMVTSVVTAPSTATVLEASELLLKHRFLAIPVVDRHGKLQGVVGLSSFTDELSGLARQHEVDNAFQLIGVHVSLGRNVSRWSSFKDRFPWLLNNIGAGILCAVIVSRYESLLSLAAVLAFFIPVVLAISESVSMQSMSLTLQTFPSRKYSWRLLTRALRREIITALWLGAACAVVVGLVAYAWRGHALTSISIAVAIALSVLTACLLGVIIPGTVRRLRLDPRVASGPIVLALADVATLLIFFRLASKLLG